MILIGWSLNRTFVLHEHEHYLTEYVAYVEEAVEEVVLPIVLPIFFKLIYHMYKIVRKSNVYIVTNKL